MVKQEYSHLNNIEALIDDDVGDNNDEEDPIFDSIIQMDNSVEDWNIDDYDATTEGGLTGIYLMRFRCTELALNQAFVAFIGTDSANIDYDCKYAYYEIFESVAEAFKIADDNFKQLLEIATQETKMVISLLHAKLTTKMSKLKGLAEGPQWNPALHDHSSE